MSTLGCAFYFAEIVQFVETPFTYFYIFKLAGLAFFYTILDKGALSATESNWKFFKNDQKCFFTLKALFVLNIVRFLSSRFGHV